MKLADAAFRGSAAGRALVHSVWIGGDMKLGNGFVCAAVVGMAAAVPVTAAQAQMSVPASTEYVTSEQVRENNGIKIELRSGGSLVIRELVLVRDRRQNCRLILAPIIRAAEAGEFERGIVTTIHLKRRYGTNSDGRSYVYCQGPGSNCRVKVEVN
jgi:hypothetical protein